MGKKLVDRDQTDSFIKGVIVAAQHHANGMVGPVHEIYEFMIGLIDFQLDTVMAYERNGELARATWVTLKDKRMVFSYNYPRRCILMKAGSSQGNEIASFDWNESKILTLGKLSMALRQLGIAC